MSSRASVEASRRHQTSSSSSASFHVFENVAKRSLPLSRICCRNAQAVLNVPLVLIVQPRKHRKLPTTSV
ncbi:hypothetical protein INR49_003804 [Caranx melampygus]|nr:hypothetical protein INR49_003804 [Caranx melampygus]